MRLAAIDVGTNSVHMVIADVGPRGDITVIDRVKETVRLGQGAFVSGQLAERPMELAVRSLANFNRLIKIRRVKRVRAVATSAVREARNRSTFVRRIRREAGIEVEVISGTEEARLIFIAARHAMGLDGGPYLLVDVGGGSVELVLVRDGEPLWMRSLGLGVSRLSDRFLAHDPPSEREVRALERCLEETMDDCLREARRYRVQRAIGTSGTINALVAMARAARGEEFGRLHGARASAAEIGRLRRKVLQRDVAKRLGLAGMDAKRADLMPATAMLADHVLRRSGASELVACTWALREGLLLKLAGLGGPRGAADARRHSVETLARRFDGLGAHGRTVARLAGQLFDATAAELKLGSHARELLGYAALLHDIGHTIDHDRHNRHSYYLIRNAELLGFDPDEIEVLAQAARGHRKGGAGFDSPELRQLVEPRRRLVRGLAAILRIADALDRSHFSVVRSIKVSKSPGRLIIEADSASDNAQLELWTCERRKELLSKLLGRRVIMRQRTARMRPAARKITARLGQPT
jgi:exopolyphosphatase / guanosine-5'-triphosphate,3'-diphosphate pyrophosphatase